MAAKKSSTTSPRVAVPAKVDLTKTVTAANAPVVVLAAAEATHVTPSAKPPQSEDVVAARIDELPKLASAVATELKKIPTEVKTQMDKTIKSTEDFVAFNQGNVEAFLKASQIWTTGLQDISKQFAASAQASFDETVASVKALTSVKSLKEAVDLQTSLTKTSFEKFVAESGKLTDASVKLAEQAIAPLTARVTLATEKFGKAA